MSFRLISDPRALILNNWLIIKDESLINETLIILGDLIDSTCIGNINKRRSSENKKAFNLQNLQWINDNKNVKKIEAVLVGNRDLNKLKCIPL